MEMRLINNILLAFISLNKRVIIRPEKLQSWIRLLVMRLDHDDDYHNKFLPKCSGCQLPISDVRIDFSPVLKRLLDSNMITLTAHQSLISLTLWYHKLLVSFLICEIFFHNFLFSFFKIFVFFATFMSFFLVIFCHFLSFFCHQHFFIHFLDFGLIQLEKSLIHLITSKINFSFKFSCLNSVKFEFLIKISLYDT